MLSCTFPRAPKFALIGFALTAMFASAQAQTYNARRDFTPRTDTNPNGAWSYGYLASTSNALVPYPVFGPTPTNDGSVQWTDPGHLALNTPSFWKNLSGNTIDGVATGQVSLHPGPENAGSPFDDASVLRFTAPTTGAYKVHATFFAGDGGETEAWIVKNHRLEQPLAHFPSTSINPAWGRTLNLKAGATLEFIVGHSSDGFLFDNTPLSVVITKQ